MTFKEVVAQVIVWLQQDQRISYRALQRQFALDDAYLADLKEALLYAYPQVSDDGRGLVWTGPSEEAPTPRRPPSQPVPPAGAPREPAAQGGPLRADPESPAAERRQLTVLFCDLVDSTGLASQLDPEDLRDVVRAYQEACATVIARFEGHIAQFLGDGLLVYFGYPQAHEDDAHRAVRTGLGILEQMAELHRRLHREQGIHLALRMGIHTGLVVVGAMGGAQRQEQLALGDVPNIAARIQGLAQPNTLAVSEATSRLVDGYFTCEALGAQTLRGVRQPLPVYRVLGESGVHSRLDIARARGLTPLVGRAQEVGLLVERWEHVKAGQGHVVVLMGDPGIGKSRLVQSLKDHVAHEVHVRWECRSLPYYQHTALYPVTELLQRILQWQPDETPDEKVAKLEQTLRQYRLPLHESVPLFASLLSLPLPDHRYPPLTLTPQRQRQKTLETLVTMLLEHAEQRPVLFIVEDLHWTDPSTLALLDLLIDHTPTAALLTVLTCRPTFQPPWGHRSYLTEVTVNRLAQPQIARMTSHVADGKLLPTQVLHHIVDKTDGVPLFVEEITKAILESSDLTEIDGRYELLGSLATVAIPATLQDSLMARLDRLGTAKGIAQYAAVIGRQFAYALLHAVAHVDEGLLQHELGKLVEAEIVHRRGIPPHTTYSFKHALIQEAAYQSLLRSTRQQYHQRIAQMLEARFPALVETQPELVAQHYTAANCAEQAVVYWTQAGQHASDRSAHLEAISHVTTGIEVLKTLPETPEHTQHALTLYIALGASLQMAKGQSAPEVEHAYTQAYALCQHVGETPRLIIVLFGLWRFYIGRPQLHRAREIGETLLRLAHHTNDPALVVIAHYALGVAWLRLGALPAARHQLEEAIARYTPAQRHALVFRIGQDPGVTCRLYAAQALWLLGYPAQALTRVHEALALAHELSHPYSLAFARCFTAFVAQFRGDVPAVYEQAEAAVALATEQSFPLWAAMGTSFQGWALALQGRDEEGLAQVRQGITAWRATGAALHVPYLCTLLADVAARLGHREEGLQALAEAATLVEQHDERWWEAEVCRLRGVVLLRQPGTPHAEAEACFQQALDVARGQEAKSLELRAAMSLSRLWQQQGKQDAARELLAPIYGWFTEGFDTADLQEAKALLEELGG